MTHELDTDLVRTNIRRKDHKKIWMQRIGSEPFYSIVRRIVDTQDTEKKDLAFLLEERSQQCKNWKDKYFGLKKSIKGTMDNFVDSENGK